MKLGLAPAVAIALLVTMSASAVAGSPPRATARRSPTASLPPIGMSQLGSFPGGFVTRWDFSAAYFPPMDQLVLFGGAPKIAGELWHNDTWIYSGGSWTQGPAAPAGLTPRGGAAMAYDPDIGELVLFGGADPEWPPVNNDTWLWDGSQWTAGPSAPTGLTPRTAAKMAYDGALHEIVMFGGSGLRGTNQTWLFNGTAWHAGPAAPSALIPRANFGMSYDPVRHVVVVAGGDGGTDVWFFDGTSWTPGPSMPATLGAMERINLAWDPDLGGDVMFGGIDAAVPSHSLWSLNRTGWVKIPDAPTNPGWPKSRVDPAVVWVVSLDAVLIFGGENTFGNGNNIYTDVWAFRDPGPHLDSVTLTPANPNPPQTITATPNGVGGGYGNLKTTYQWYVNGNLVSGETAHRLPGPHNPGDQIQAFAEVTDGAGATSGWVASNVVTVGGAASGPPIVVSAATAQANGDAASPGPAQANPAVPGWVPGRAAGSGSALPGAPSDQVTAHDGQFWLNGSPIVLRGVSQFRPMSLVNFQDMVSWGMNVVRVPVHWSLLEPNPPTHNPDGTWTHTYDPVYLQTVLNIIHRARKAGLHIIICNYGQQRRNAPGRPFFPFPAWLYTAPYNSHNYTYQETEADLIKSFTDFWSDTLMKQFMTDFWQYLAGQMVGVQGVDGYELLNEPQWGTLAKDITTSQLIVDWEAQLAQMIRNADPDRMIFLMTRGSIDYGLAHVDLSAFKALGNVAIDFHDYFGGRLGNGYIMDPTDARYLEIASALYIATSSGDIPYIGTEVEHERLLATVAGWAATEFVPPYTAWGFPILIGEFGDNPKDPAAGVSVGNVVDAANALGISWAANYQMVWKSPKALAATAQIIIDGAGAP